MEHRTRVRAGMLVAAALAADAAVHLYWTTGALWPAREARALSLAVLNFEVPFTPRVLLPLAALLTAASLTMAAGVGRLGRLGRAVPRPLLRLGTLAIAAGTLLRGVFGVAWALGNGTDTSTPFYWLNVFVYTPLCLALFTATMIARRARPV
ncbi:DUF3995 domain-containing protein [Sphaerisporangium fuscum]|uniref:DUF3995 domain-containing protein n=1 Tax=Sphaerisporangium fuscum TaxID=2835868 RepID=UPI001BDD814F|nr:DUF3995 domain-containing protein [Sphaerisporangium fuscum]